MHTSARLIEKAKWDLIEEAKWDINEFYQNQNSLSKAVNLNFFQTVVRRLLQKCLHRVFSQLIFRSNFIHIQLYLKKKKLNYCNKIYLGTDDLDELDRIKSSIASNGMMDSTEIVANNKNGEQEQSMMSNELSYSTSFNFSKCLGHVSL